MTVLRQMNSAPTINQLLKTIPPTIERPIDADWGERYDEAATLLRSNKIVLAENKLESLQRLVSQEPAVLSGLLTCAIWRGDAEAARVELEALCDDDHAGSDRRFVGAHLALARVLTQLGDAPAAAARYARYRELGGTEPLEAPN